MLNREEIIRHLLLIPETTFLNVQIHNWINRVERKEDSEYLEVIKLIQERINENELIAVREMGVELVCYFKFFKHE